MDLSRRGHITRFSDASTFDEICELCGATDRYGSSIDNKPCVSGEEREKRMTALQERNMTSTPASTPPAPAKPDSVHSLIHDLIEMTDTSEGERFTFMSDAVVLYADLLHEKLKKLHTLLELGDD